MTKILDPREDGKEHINIWSRGRTELGRRLSFFSREPFVHPTFGAFDSMEAAWYWLATGCQHDGLRQTAGFAAKHVGRLLPRVQRETFREDVLSCLRCKLEQTEDLRELLRESSLRFEHYYCYGDIEKGPDKVKVIPLPQHQWWVDEIERIRSELKASSPEEQTDASSNEPLVEPPEE